MSGSADDRSRALSVHPRLSPAGRTHSVRLDTCDGRASEGATGSEEDATPAHLPLCFEVIQNRCDPLLCMTMGDLLMLVSEGAREALSVCRTDDRGVRVVRALTGEGILPALRELARAGVLSELPSFEAAADLLVREVNSKRTGVR